MFRTDKTSMQRHNPVILSGAPLGAQSKDLVFPFRTDHLATERNARSLDSTSRLLVAWDS
jgi:hypothetical protein